ncbi:hypothetical protein ACFE04_027472 [Oxalis oulophora]
MESVTSFLWSSLLILFPLIILVLKFNMREKKKRKLKNLPPGPPSLPIIGNLHQLGALPHQSLHQLSIEYGPVIFLKLGQVPTVVVSSADSAKQVLKTHDLECCTRPPIADVAFAPYGDYWREMRKICVLELFTLESVQSFRSIREQEVEFMINSISEHSSTSTHVDLSHMILTMTADITCKVAFGSFSAADFFPYFGWIVDRITGLYKRRERSFHDLDSFYQKVIDDHLDARKSNKKDHQDYDIIDNIFLAGVDTSTITVVFAMAELARNPRIMRKAQEEINGYDIYPGTRIHVNVWGIGRDPNIWENPEEFIPERFEDNHVDYKGQHFVLLPFGSGRRGCPGIFMGCLLWNLLLQICCIVLIGNCSME